ncbi:MAG: IucA/IucC family protein, partial [Myxococcota bacterium]
LEELTATASSLAFHFENQRFDAVNLAAAEFQDIESSMSAGHPCFVANSGRIGFNSEEYGRFAPEANTQFPLEWVAVSKERAHFCSIGVNYAEHMERELGAERLQQFEQSLSDLNLHPDDYLYMPIHPWQWSNRIATVFADEIARRRIVRLGQSCDRYQAQQSIRTLYNVSTPSRAYVKTSLSVLNMGFMRGLSPEYMAATPAINQWVHETLKDDGILCASNFTVLREFAAVGYRHPVFEHGAPKGSPRRKMLAALWRESPQLSAGEQAMTMAALLHRDRDGDPLLRSLIQRSGLEANDWLERYLDVYLVPIVHCFFAYELAFMPHGENLILRFENGVPIGAFIKDIGEEVIVFNTDREMPALVQRIAQSFSDDVRVLS